MTARGTRNKEEEQDHQQLDQYQPGMHSQVTCDTHLNGLEDQPQHNQTRSQGIRDTSTMQPRKEIRKSQYANPSHEGKTGAQDQAYDTEDVKSHIHVRRYPSLPGHQQSDHTW